MRGFKSDTKASAVLRKNGLFEDLRSRLVYDGNYKPHLLLWGMDKSRQRARVFAKSRSKCKICQTPITPDSFEMDHINGGLSGRCDCIENLQALCHTCHNAKHGRYPRFGEGRAQAVRDFDAVQGEQAHGPTERNASTTARDD